MENGVCYYKFQLTGSRFYGHADRVCKHWPTSKSKPRGYSCGGEDFRCYWQI
jgi:hypothetical protein